MADCKTCKHENICTMPEFVRNNLKACKVYDPKKKKTNADLIRSMSDEELAEFFECCSTICELCKFNIGCSNVENVKCKNGILQWLQSEEE